MQASKEKTETGIKRFYAERKNQKEKMENKLQKRFHKTQKVPRKWKT